MSEEEKEVSTEEAVSEVSEATVADTDKASVKAAQILKFFEIKTVEDDAGRHFKMEVRDDVQGTLSKDELDKQLSDVQTFFTNNDWTSKDAGEKPVTLADGTVGNAPIFVPDNNMDVATMECLEVQQRTRDFFDIKPAFSYDYDENGALRIKQRPEATAEQIEVARKAMKREGWDSNPTTVEGKDKDGNKIDLLLFRPANEKENGFATIYGEYLQTGRINGNKTDVATIVGQGGNLKNEVPTLDIDTGYGDGDGIFEERIPRERRLFAPWNTPNSATLGDFFVDSIIEFTAKFDRDMKQIQSDMRAYRNRVLESRARNTRDMLLDNKETGAPGLITQMAKKIEANDAEGARRDLEKIRKVVGRNSKIYMDKKRINANLKEVESVINNTQAKSDADRAAGKTGMDYGKIAVGEVKDNIDNITMAVSNKDRLESGSLMDGIKRKFGGGKDKKTSAPKTHTPLPNRQNANTY